MAQLSLVDAQRNLLGIITSVEAGVTTPEEAVQELNGLKSDAPLTFRPNYTLEDFQNIAKAAATTYESSTTETFDSSYESSGY